MLSYCLADYVLDSSPKSQRRRFTHYRTEQMALTQENVHYILNSGPGLMNRQVEQGSCADPGIFVRRGGGGGGGGRGPTARKQSGQCFFSHQLILQFTEWIQWFYYRGEDGVQLLPGGGGVQRNPYNL